MKCPHCNTAIHEDWGSNFGNVASELYRIQCPECDKPIIKVKIGDWNGERSVTFFEKIVYPEYAGAATTDKSVPSEFAEDYIEAKAVLPISPKASASLSRRCLQNLLHNKLGIKKANLNQEIDECIKTGTLPSDLLDMIDAIRNVGNFGAHPIKSTSTSQIVEVEPGEAELCLELIEEMFDHLFVKPAQRDAKIAALNVKLAAAGKPLVKRTTS